MSSHKKIAAFAFTIAFFFSSSAFANFDVDFAPGTPIIDAVRSLGYRANKNIVINGELTGTVALSISNTTFNDVIDILALTHGFTYTDQDGVVLVSPAQTMSIMETIKLKHMDLDYAKKQMELILDEDKIFVNPDMGTISVNGSSGQIAQVRQQLQKLDVAQPQINVQATVIELSNSKARDMGLTFTSESWSKDTSISGYNGFKFNVTSHHEETISKGNILARPSITTFNGRKATILMGDKVPVFTSTTNSTSNIDSTVTVDYKDIGVKLEVVPRINEEDRETITMVLKPSISTITSWVESGNNKAPQISTREAETIVRVKSGETILIGGLLKDEEVKNIKALPFLSKIPILGELFKSRSTEKKNTEILIAITPRIVYDLDGRPTVEMQSTTPTLNKKLKELQAEPVERNNPSEEQKTLENRNSKLSEKLEKLERENKKLKLQNKYTTEELNKNNKTIKKFLGVAKE